jgi:hypothetical protein
VLTVQSPVRSGSRYGVGRECLVARRQGWDVAGLLRRNRTLAAAYSGLRDFQVAALAGRNRARLAAVGKRTAPKKPESLSATRCIGSCFYDGKPSHYPISEQRPLLALPAGNALECVFGRPGVEGGEKRTGVRIGKRGAGGWRQDAARS